MRTLVFVLVVLLLAVLAWGLASSSNVTIMVNGEELRGAERMLATGWGVLVAIVALFCVATLLAFVLAGVGLIVLGALLFVGLAGASMMFPFLLPLLVPLFVVWAFVAYARRDKTRND
jgi:hypothetical protein